VFTDDQRATLDALYIPDDRRPALLRGEAITALFGTGGSPLVIVVQLRPPRLRGGVIEVNAPGRGMFMLLEVRAACEHLARAFELTELELFGAAVLNTKLADVQRRHGFEVTVDACPDDLGGGTMEILTQVFSVTAE
jgi:hypothetical protein